MNGRKATYEERKWLEKKGINTREWLIQKNTPTFMQLVNRTSGEEITVAK